MPDRINIIRPDGTTTSATPAQAEKLLKLGYKLESTEELEDRARQQVERESFQTPGHQIVAGLEGVASGLTLSGSDLLLDDASTRARAAANPGTRIAGEIVGAVLPAIATAGSTAPASGAMTAGRVLRGALAATPAGAVSRLAGGRVVAGAALEGAAAGAAGEVTQAVLSGEPVLAENVLAGAGWGTVFGTGIGAAALGIGKGLKAVGRVDGAAPSIIDADAHLAVKLRIDEAVESYSDILSKAKAAKTNSEIFGRQIKELDSVAVATPKAPTPAKMKAAERELYSIMKELDVEDIESARALLKATPASVDDATKVGKRIDDTVVIPRTEVSKTSRDASAAIASKAHRNSLSSLESALVKYDSALDDFEMAGRVYDNVLLDNAATGLKTAEAKRIAKEQIAASRKAFDDHAKLASALKILRRMPGTPEDFLRMKNVEELWGAVDTVMSSGVRGIDGLKAGIKDSIEQLSTKTGMDLSGKSPATQLREVWRTAKAAQLTNQTTAKKGGSTWFRGLQAQIGGRVASSQASKMGLGPVGTGAAFFGAKSIILDNVLGLAGNVRGKIATAVEKMGPAAKRFTPVVAGKSVPLTLSILGRDTKDKSDTRTLAKKRVDEVAALAPTIREGAFKVVEPFIEEHTDFGYNLYNSLVTAFTALYEMMPKDPGTSFSGFKSLWKPSDIQAAQINSLLKVFHYPVETIEGMLKNLGKQPISAIEVEAVRRMYPEGFNQLRDGVLTKLMESGDEFDYGTQVQLSTLVGTPMHSSLLPQNIAAAQSLYIPKPQEKPKTPGLNRGGGRPPSSEAPTPGQILANGGRA